MNMFEMVSRGSQISEIALIENIDWCKYRASFFYPVNIYGIFMTLETIN